MAAITSADVTYTDKNVYSPQIGGLPPRRKSTMQVAFGGGTNKTYPTNGVPLDKGKLGMQVFIESIVVFDASGAPDTHLWTYDLGHNTLRAYSAEATEFSGDFSAAQTLILEVKGW